MSVYIERITQRSSMQPADFVTYANDWVTPYSTQNFTATTYLQGNADRYYRANETGLLFRTSSR